MSSWAIASRCFGSEPELAPIRIGMPAALAASTTSLTLSGPPMLPGLMRTAATPESIAFSARLALKWMSAITGIGEKRTMRGERLGVLDLRDGAAHDLAAGRDERGDLRGRRLDVARRRRRHRLDGDGRAAADRDAADVDLPRAGHASIVEAAPRGAQKYRCTSFVSADVHQERDERETDEREALHEVAAQRAADAPARRARRGCVRRRAAGTAAG